MKFIATHASAFIIILFSMTVSAYDPVVTASSDCLKNLGFIPSKRNDLLMIFNPKSMDLCIYKESLSTGTCYSRKDLKKCTRNLEATQHLIVQINGEILLVITDENGVTAITENLKYEPPNRPFCNLKKEDDPLKIKKGFYSYVEFALSKNLFNLQDRTNGSTEGQFKETIDGISFCQKSSDDTISKLSLNTMDKIRNLTKDNPTKKKGNSP